MSATATTIAGRCRPGSIVPGQARAREQRAAAHLNVSRVVVLVALFGLPLVVVPGWELPFSRPKLLLWVIIIAAGLLTGAARLPAAWREFPPRLRLALLLWLAALGASAAWGQFASLPALLLPLAGVGWLVVLVTMRPSAERASWCLVLSGSAVAALALAQFFHADPFAALGWISATPGNSRMHVFATLGNPNFVAAFLSGLLPLTISLVPKSPRRWLFGGLCALQAIAILATGSRAPVAALLAALLWMSCIRGRRWLPAFGMAVLGIAAFAAFASPARDLATTLRGRAYIWKVAAPHLREHLLLGLGPGGFAAEFPAWEAQFWRTATDVRDRKFAGIEDHAHNDYLELLADYGLTGLLAFLGILMVFLGTVADRKAVEASRLHAGASAGVVALAVISLVDFPLMRPTETFLFWSLIAICLLSRRQCSTDRSSGKRSAALSRTTSV